jgi:branched-chain amino acid transport system permease protein
VSGLRRTGRPASIAAICVIALLAFYLSDYSLFQLSRVLAIAIAVLSLNLLTGFTGQISVGHGALFGIGAYVVAVLTVKLSVPYGIAMVAAAAGCFAVGLLIGIPALRIRGLYLGLLTLGLAVTLPPLLKRIPDITGGVYGLNVVTPDAPLGLPLTSAQWTYLLGVALLAGSMLVLRNLSRGRFGRACDALRTSEAMAASSGVGVGRLKIVVFAISAAMAGVGGGIYQLVLGATTPDTFAVTLSLSLITASILGGIRSLWGAVIGAAFVVYVPDEAAALGDSAPQFVYAGVLLAVIYLLPGGVARLPQRVAAAAAGVRASRPVLRTTGTNPEGGGTP